MKALSGLDGLFLHLETPETPMHVASLSLFERPAGARGRFHTAVKRQIAQRLDRVPALTRRLAEMPLQFANPVWVHDDAVDLDHHVQHRQLAAPGTLAQLEDLVATLHAELLPRDRPLWRLVVIDGLDSGLVGYYMQVHHAVLDGMAGVQLAQALFDATPQPPRGRRAASGQIKAANSPGERPEAADAAEHPGAVALAAAALRHDSAQVLKLLRQLPDLARTLSGLLAGPGTGDWRQNLAFGPRTALNVPIGPARRFAGLSVPLDQLKALARAHQAKLNDVVLSLTAGALRRWLAKHGGIPRKSLMAAMPVSLREAGNTEYTTQVTMTLVKLHSHIADPVRRLHAIRDASGAMKALTGRARGLLPTDFPTIASPWLMHGLATVYGRSGLARALPPLANLVVSNVPGPPVPLYTAGARMVSYWPVSIVEHGVGLNLTVMSYAGALGFGFTAARDAVPDARAFTQALQLELQALASATAAMAAPPAVASALKTLPAPATRRARRSPTPELLAETIR